MSPKRKSNRRRYRPRRERYIPRKTKRTILLCLLSAIVIGLLAVAFAKGWITLPELPEEPQETVAPTQPPEDTVIHIVAGGDVNITDRVVNSGGNGYDYSDMLTDVLPILGGGDLTLLNFEGNVYGMPYGSQQRSAPVELLQALRLAGVDVLQTANSQAVTNGLLGLAATKKAIRDAGMQALGTYSDEEDFERYDGYLIYQIQGIKIALVAFTKGMDGRSLPEGSEYCVNLLYTDYGSTYQSINKDGIKDVLRAVEKESPDLTIAMLHWGSEYNDQINSTQKEITKLLKEQGVDAIIGSHPHYVQAMEHDPESGFFLAYSLGDFLGDAQMAGTDYSVLLDLEVTKDGHTGQTKVTGFSYTPIYQVYDEEGGLRVLRINEAIAAYENDYIGKVTQEIYRAMKSALGKIEDRINP